MRPAVSCRTGDGDDGGLPGGGLAGGGDVLDDSDRAGPVVTGGGDDGPVDAGETGADGDGREAGADPACPMHGVAAA